MNYSPYSEGGIGIIPRRMEQDPRLLFTREKLASFASSSPMRLLAMLPDIHPIAGLATWNALRLTCPPQGMGGLRIVAVSPEDLGKDATTIDDVATAEIEELWKAQPREFGGLIGIQTTLTLHALFTGLPCAEAVAGPALKGVHRVIPVDSLTIAFGRKAKDADITAYQRQAWNGSTSADSGGYGAATMGFQELRPETLFWHSVDNFADDPYGRAPYAPALSEILCDLALIKDLRDCVHNSAWPRHTVNVDVNELYKTAQEAFGLSAEEASVWVMEQMDAIRAKMAELGPDDNPIIPSSIAVTVIEGGKGLGNLTGILDFLQKRIVQALKTLPTMLGISEGSTETFATVEYRVAVAGLETIRGMVTTILTDIATLHLRLRGRPFVAKAIFEPIRAGDAMMETNTETVKIKNAIQKFVWGFIDHNQASQEITGNDPVAEPDTGMILLAGGKSGETLSLTEPPKSDTPGDTPKVPKPGKAPKAPKAAALHRAAVMEYRERLAALTGGEHA